MLTQRLGSETQKNPSFIDGLIKEINAHPGCCDEVWLATDYGFPPLEVHEKTAEILTDVADKMRKANIRVSLQLSNSIGHGEYMSSKNCDGLVYGDSPVRHMVGADGKEAGYCFCWNDKYLRDYTKKELGIYAEKLKPYTVWLDDDLRAGNHSPVSYGCFCDSCIASFNKKYNCNFTRNEIVNEINNGDTSWRKNWIDFVSDGVSDFTFDICSSIHAVSPNTRVGLQGASHGGYTGLGNGFVMDAIRKATGHDAPYRPGGGAYDDKNPSIFLDKAEDMAYQCCLLDENVTEFRPEIESLPDIFYGKSIGGTCFETSYYLSDGNNAMSYAILMNDFENMSWHGKMLAAFSSHRKYWGRMCEVNRHSHQTGLKIVYPKNAFLAKSENPFDWTREHIHYAMPLRYFNIPLTFTDSGTSPCVVNSEKIKLLTDEELTELLKRPVITDGASADYLYKRGLFPVGAKRIESSRLMERFTSHTVNSNAKGKVWEGKWDVRPDYEIIDDNNAAEIVSVYEACSGTSDKDGSIASCIVTTSYGAKWAVFGFDAWNDGVSTDVRNMYVNTIKYISGKGCDAELVTPIRMIVSARVNDKNRTVCASFTNLTVGDSGELEAIIHRPATKHFTLMGQYLEETELEYIKLSEDEYKIIIPNVRAWSVATVFVD